MHCAAQCCYCCSVCEHPPWQQLFPFFALCHADVTLRHALHHASCVNQVSGVENTVGITYEVVYFCQVFELRIKPRPFLVKSFLILSCACVTYRKVISGFTPNRRASDVRKHMFAFTSRHHVLHFEMLEIILNVHVKFTCASFSPFLVPNLELNVWRKRDPPVSCPRVSVSCALPT